MVVRMRSTRSHTGNRRSHHALTSRPLTVCKDCGATRLRHTVCPTCGKYKGRQVMDVMAKTAKIEKKKRDKAAAGR